jgi:hypothetical protein
MQRDHVQIWPRQTAARGPRCRPNVPPGLTSLAGTRASIHIAREDCLRRSEPHRTGASIFYRLAALNQFQPKCLIAGIASGSSKAVVLFGTPPEQISGLVILASRMTPAALT